MTKNTTSCAVTLAFCAVTLSGTLAACAVTLSVTLAANSVDRGETYANAEVEVISKVCDKAYAIVYAEAINKTYDIVKVKAIDKDKAEDKAEAEYAAKTEAKAKYIDEAEAKASQVRARAKYTREEAAENERLAKVEADEFMDIAMRLGESYDAEAYAEVYNEAFAVRAKARMDHEQELREAGLLF